MTTIIIITKTIEVSFVIRVEFMDHKDIEVLIRVISFRGYVNEGDINI